MFTGIVEEMGTIQRATPPRLVISADKVMEGLAVGDSICVHGACLTVTQRHEGSFTVELMPETRRRTTLGSLSRGDRVNLERALAVGGRLGGHFVQGHVDATGRVVSVVPEAEAVLVRIHAPPQVMRYVVEKGFIAVDGVSLTVVDREETSFRVSLVRYTLEVTTLGRLRPGQTVNLEADILAKYVERVAQPGGLTEASLADKGFPMGGGR